jgi:hypothetical protein
MFDVASVAGVAGVAVVAGVATDVGIVARVAGVAFVNPSVARYTSIVRTATNSSSNPIIPYILLFIPKRNT